MPTEITVRGASTASRQPERGIAHASISYSGPSMEPVYARVDRDLDIVRSSVEELRDGNNPAVTWWSAERLRTWSTRPWNSDGKQLPLVHHASVDLEVKFRDFARLSAWVGKHVTTIEGFRISGIEWALTDASRDQLTRQVRTRAVQDARERAQLYADAMGLGRVTPVAIGDAGMLGTNPRVDGYGRTHTFASARGQHVENHDGSELVPKDIEITAAVDARFIIDKSASDRTGTTSGLTEAEAQDALEDIAPENDSDIVEFRDDDDGYWRWVQTHADGFVVNIQRSYSPANARLHRADCWTISPGQNKGAVTHQYVKACSTQLNDLDQWATRQVGHPITRCGTCHPPAAAAQPNPVAKLPNTQSSVGPDNRWAVDGPSTDGVVQAWADDYIRFEKLPDWQQQLRSEIRQRAAQLQPLADQVLHATYFGPKHPKSDIENVLLYYIGSFKVAGANGIRFEHGSGLAPTSDAVTYQFGYRYALVPRSNTYTHWRRGHTLASFDWTDLGRFAGENKLARVWLALARAEFDIFERTEPDGPFAVNVEVSPPDGWQPVWGGLMKGIVDGVVSALQAHTDTSLLPPVTSRLAVALPAEAAEIESHLRDQRRAVLGVAQRLVAPYRNGVKWDPCDHLCVAGELLAGEPGRSSGEGWAIRGEVFEVSRPTN
ncbi:SIMPL domain-containing protein [Mycolicibacterium elephantis]